MPLRLNLRSLKFKLQLLLKNPLTKEKQELIIPGMPPTRIMKLRKESIRSCCGADCMEDLPDVGLLL